MSIEAMTACWGPDFPAEAEGLSPQTVRLVALAIADVVNDLHGNRFYAARKNVANKVCCHPDTVTDVFKHLVKYGIIEVLKASPGRPVEYLWILGVTARQTSGDPPHPRGDTTAPPAVTSPHRNTNRSQLKNREWRQYDDDPLTPEQLAEKFGVEA